MKFDKDWHNGFKDFSVVSGIILTALGIILLMMLIVVLCDYISRGINMRHIEMLKSEGCYIVNINGDTPVYECKGQK